MSIYNISVKTIKGDNIELEHYKGHVLLIVNTASKCGLTPQYEGLQQLYHDKKSSGFEVLGFPSNDFLEQEPASDTEIEEFCSLNYQVDFPLFSKVVVVGEHKHPLYQYLTSTHPTRIGGEDFQKKLESSGITVQSAPEVLWNFEKFIINKQGEVVARFSPDTLATNPELVKVIETELAK